MYFRCISTSNIKHRKSFQKIFVYRSSGSQKPMLWWPILDMFHNQFSVHSGGIHVLTYYLTRAVSSPTSDLGKKVILCLVWGVAWLWVVRVSENLVGQPFLALFWQRFCEQSARPSMPIRIPSQIAVDCKSVHSKEETRDFRDGIKFVNKPLFMLANWLQTSYPRPKHLYYLTSKRLCHLKQIKMFLFSSER